MTFADLNDRIQSYLEAYPEMRQKEAKLVDENDNVFIVDNLEIIKRKIDYGDVEYGDLVMTE